MIPMLDRYALLLGAMKTGTTALFQALRSHPEILASVDKEPAYWIRDSTQGEGLEDYRRLWNPSEKPAARWWLEASTGYTKVPVRCSPAARLRGLPAEFRFLYVVRNPIDRIRSHYEHALAEGWIHHPITAGVDPTALWFSNYHLQLQPFVDCFGADRIHVLSHEELCARPGEALQDVCRFLEVSTSPCADALPRANNGSDYRMQRLTAARRQAPDEGHAPSDHELQIALAKEVTPTAENVEQIHAALDADLQRFQDTFGIDAWTGQRVPAAIT